MRSDQFNVVRSAFEYAKNVNAYSIENLEDYKTIVSGRAYTDMTPRTIKDSNKESAVDALNQLAEEIYTYIHDEENYGIEEYNSWHHETCENFLSNYLENTGIPIKYGKAQKILNMSMKYLYCFHDSQVEYSSKFLNCHMPLDNLTMEWFVKEVIPWSNANKENISVSEFREIKWSNLEYSSDDVMFSYSWFQNHIYSFLHSDSNQKYRNVNNEPLTALVAEFYIWSEQKVIAALKSILNQYYFDDTYPRYNDTNIDEACRNLSEKLNRRFPNN